MVCRTLAGGLIVLLLLVDPVPGRSEPGPRPADLDVSFRPGEGITFAWGEGLSLNLKSVIQPQYRFSDHEDGQDQSTFRLRLARTTFSGHVFGPATQYRLQLEWKEGVSVKDAWIEQVLFRGSNLRAAIRLGQQKTLFGRETSGSSTATEFVDFSLAGLTFSGVRSQGMNLLLEGWGGRLHANAGAFNRPPAGGSLRAAEEGFNFDHKLDYTLGLRWGGPRDLGDLGYRQGDTERSASLDASVGAAVWFGREELGELAGGDLENETYAVHGLFKGFGLHYLAEFFYDDSRLAGESAESLGVTIQGSYVFESGFTGGIRYSAVEWLDPPLMVSIPPLGPLSLFSPASAGDAIGGSSFETEGLLYEFGFLFGRYWAGHARKLQVDLTFQFRDPDIGAESTDIIFRIQYTLVI